MKLSITGARSELGRVLARMPARGPHASVHVNVSGQQANTLLHDGHAWKDFARTMPGTTRRALRDTCPQVVPARRSVPLAGQVSRNP
jgi:hypothetical protein